MAWGKSKKTDGVLRGVALAHLILVLHLLLFGAIGLLVLFFSGIMLYLPWILMGGLVVILVSAVYFYRRLKSQGRSLGEMMRTPLLQGRSMEVSLLGGLASVKIGQKGPPPVLGDATGEDVKQLEEPTAGPVRELSELAHLLESGMITRDEYEQTKKSLLKRAQAT